MRIFITRLKGKSPNRFEIFRASLFALAFSIATFSYTATAQVADYVFSQTLGTYTPITGGDTLGTPTSDDQRFVDPSAPAGGATTTGVGLPIGFTFFYAGSNYDRFGVNANGWIALGQSILTPSVNLNSSSSYTSISATSTASPNILQRRIVAFGRDLQAQAGAQIRYETIGTAPSRTLVVQWINYRKFSATGDAFSFQIRLNEADSSVNIVYGAFTVNATSTTGQVGLRGISNTDFNNRSTTSNWSASVAGTINTASMTLSQTVLPPAGLSFNWSPPPPSSLDLAASRIILGTPTGCTPSTENISVRVFNSGLSLIDFSTDTLTINIGVTGPLAQSFSAVISSGTLAPGDSALYPVTSILDLNAPGTYNITGNVALSADGLAGNNNFPPISRTQVNSVNGGQYYTGFDQSTTVPSEITAVGYILTTASGFSASAPRAIRRNHFNVGTQSGRVTLPVINNIASGLNFRFNYSIREFSTPQPASTVFGPIFIQASTDCGSTFTTIDSIVVSNHIPTTNFTAKNVNISAFVGQNVQFRIASEWDGVGDYYVTLDDIGVYSSALSAFTLANPVSGTTLNVQGNATTPVSINWNRTTNITNPVVNYTWLLDAPTGNFTSPLLSIPSNNSGQDSVLTLTFLDIDNALASLSVALGDTVDAKWTVRAIVGTDTSFATSSFDLTLIRGGLQSSLTSFSLISPPDGSSVNIAGDANTAVPTISWQRSVEQFAAQVSYTWLLDALTGDFSNPLAAIASGNGGLDTTLNLTFGQVDALLASLNVSKGTTLNLKWTVRASSALVDSLASNVFTINITRGGLVPALFKGPVPAITGGSSTFGRAPVTQALFHRSSSVYTPTEVSQVLVVGDTLKSIGFDVTTASAAAVSGNIKVYLVNSTDVTFARSTTWADLIALPTPMTLVYDGPLTIPNAVGYYDIFFTTPFVYSGDGLYWAFEWVVSSATSTSASYRCNSTGVTNGSRNINNNTSLGATLTSQSSFRPVNRYSVSRAGNDLRIAEVYAFGKNDPLSIDPYTINALVINEGSQPITNRTVSLGIAGTNTVTNTANVTLFSGDTALVSFSGISTPINGNDVITISAPADDVLSNNSRSFNSEVLDGVLAYANDGPTSTSVGFNTGAGILVARHTINQARTLTGLQIFIAPNAASIGKSVFGVLLNDQDSIVQRTPDIVLSSADTSSWVNFNFPNATVLGAGTFSVGLGQNAGTPGYFPMGVQAESPVRPNAYFFRVNLADTGEMVPSTLGRYMIRVITTDTGSTICAFPSNLSLSNISASTATASWNVTTPSIGYQVEFGTTGFTQGTGTILNVTDTFANITGLLAQTGYQVYVRNICAAGDTSVWTGPVSFTTACPVFPLSYVENFESSSISLACWTLGTGWATQPVSGFGVGSQSIRFNFYNITAGTRADALSATFAPTPAGHRLAFDHAYATYTGGEIDSLIVYTSTDNGTSWTQLVAIPGGPTGPLNTFGGSGQTVSSFVPTSTQWSTFSTAIPTGVNRIRFEAVSDFGNNLFIDNVTVEPIPSCVVPTGLVTSAISTTGATLSWVTTAANSQVQWGVTGFSLGTGTTINVADTFTTLSGLTQNTSYQFYVRSICAPGDTSAWSLVAGFTTPCAPVSVPYAQNFDAVTAPALPACITVESNGGSPWQNVNVGALSPPIVLPSSPNAMISSFNLTQAKNDWFFTAPLNLSSNDLYKLEFQYRGAGWQGVGEDLRVTLHTSASSGSAVDTIWLGTNLIMTSFSQADTNFSVASSGTYYLGFHAFSAADLDFIAVDDIEVSVVTGFTLDQPISGLQVFPNPSTGIFNLKFENALSNATINITDLTGKVLMERNLNADGGIVDTTIDLSNFAQGMYFARIINGETVQTIKLRKE